MAPPNSKDLLVLENRSKEQHLEKLLASRTKPNIERLQSSVLQDVRRFLPLMQKANENLKLTSRDQSTAATDNKVEEEVSNDEDSASHNDLCCEVGEDFEGPAVELSLMLAAQDQLKMISDLEDANRTLAQTDSETSSMSEDSEVDSSSDAEMEQSSSLKNLLRLNKNIESSEDSGQRPETNAKTEAIEVLPS